MYNNKELIEFLEKKTEEINQLIKVKKTLTRKEILKVDTWLDQAINLLEDFERKETSTYKFLIKLRESEIKIPKDINIAIAKFNNTLEYIKVKFKNSFTTPYPISVEKENGSYWDKI